MTKLTKNVTRETFGTRFDRGNRAVIVTLKPPNLVCFRLKGTRREYALPAETLYGTAMMCYIRAEQKEKAKAKKSRRRR